MSFHIITLTTPGLRLSVEYGSLVCTHPASNSKNRIALEDVRAIIVAVPAVSFTNQVIARLLENDTVILHCNEQYQPIGWSVPTSRVVRREAFVNQMQQEADLDDAIWEVLLLKKLENQAAHLDLIEAPHSLDRLIHRPLVSEGNVAKQYWAAYFTALHNPQKRDYPNATSFENGALNYGYAVLSTLVHRAILIHGLLPELGVHHQPRFRAHPLVYDVMEPFRVFIEHSLWLFIHKHPQPDDYESSTKEDQDFYFKQWITWVTTHLRTLRIKRPQDKHSYKLMDAVDRCVRSLATAFEKKMPSDIWLPAIENVYVQTEKELAGPEEDPKTSPAI